MDSSVVDLDVVCSGASVGNTDVDFLRVAKYRDAFEHAPAVRLRRPSVHRRRGEMVHK